MRKGEDREREIQREDRERDRKKGAEREDRECKGGCERDRGTDGRKEAVVKNPPANAGDMGLIPGPGRSLMVRSS